MRYAKRCGVRASTQGLARNAGLIKHLLGASAPDGIVRALIEANRDGELGDIAPHLFSFGGIGATARWAASVAAGGSGSIAKGLRQACCHHGGRAQREVGSISAG